MMVAESAERRRGIALVGVVLLMLGMTLLAHGLLVLAEVELRASRAGANQLRARAAAEAAIAAVVADTVTNDRGVTPLWSVGDSARGALPDPLGRDSLHAARWWGGLRRLSREIWLSEGRGEAGPVASQSVAAPVWILDPTSRVAETQAVVLVGDTATVLVDGRIEAAAFTEVPVVEPPGGCIDRLFALDSITGSLVIPEVAAAPPDHAGHQMAGHVDLGHEIDVEHVLPHVRTGLQANSSRRKRCVARLCS